MSIAKEQPSGDEDWAIDKTPDVLTRIYANSIAIAIWQRQPEADISAYMAELLRKPKTIALKLSGTPEQLVDEIQHVFPSVLITEQNSYLSAAAFYADVHRVLDMFSCLFDAQTLGLRINTLDNAMCPRFHTDKIAIRLITTYFGLATEWLPSAVADRYALGSTLASQVNTPGAIVRDEKFIQRMAAGDVALLKGELWEGNEGRGVIHRSPAITPIQPKRLVMTCDLID